MADSRQTDGRTAGGEGERIVGTHPSKNSTQKSGVARPGAPTDEYRPFVWRGSRGSYVEGADDPALEAIAAAVRKIWETDLFPMVSDLDPPECVFCHVPVEYEPERYLDVDMSPDYHKEGCAYRLAHEVLNDR